MEAVAQMRGANGLTVVSTFSGCGGSCLGFEMAGYRVLWASEFIPAARKVYALNHPGIPIDARDIRTVRPEEILEAVGRERGDVDVLEGSPPCASFSTAGKRSNHWNQVRQYSEVKQRTDDLFFEFARIVEGVQPRVFVAENVSGLVKGIAKGYFKMILARLRECGYRVEARLLDAQWLGVPQARQRLIFIGVRRDLGLAPAFPRPLPYRYSVRDALPWIHHQEGNGSFGFEAMLPANRPLGTIGAIPRTGNGSFPPAIIEAETDISRYAIGAEWDTLKPGESSDKYFNLVKPRLHEPSPTITAKDPTGGSAQVCHPTEKRKFTIAELKRICAFPDDFQLTGTYAQQWERLGRAVPPLMMQAIASTIRDAIFGRGL
jgi:DNA (cytosine-5)-methyltransferase 1